MEFVVREAVAADAEAVGAVRVASWRETYAHVLSAKFLDELGGHEDIGRWRTTIESGRTAFHVAEVAGEVVGFSLAGPPREANPPRDWELAALYQLSRVHGSGTGQALLEAAVGDRPALVWVVEDNPRAHAFYRRNGFRPDGAHKIDERWEDLAEVRMVR